MSKKIRENMKKLLLVILLYLLCLTSCTISKERFFYTLFVNNVESMQDKLHDVKQLYDYCPTSDDRICLLVGDSTIYGGKICYTITFTIMEEVAKDKAYKITDSLFFAFDEDQIENGRRNNDCVAGIIDESSLKLLVSSSYSECRLVYCDFDIFSEMIIQFNKDLHMYPFDECMLEKACVDTTIDEFFLIREEP